MEYESRSGLVALLHRLGLEYRKPEVIPRHLDETKQRAFIKLYEKLMNALGADEAVLFVDAVHPTHGARAAGCWAAKDEHLAIEQTTGRQRLNIHGAIDLETGRTKMIEAEAIDAASTIKLLAGIEALYSTTALIHVFLDNARYHHAKIVRKWLSQPGRRLRPCARARPALPWQPAGADAVCARDPWRGRRGGRRDGPRRARLHRAGRCPRWRHTVRAGRLRELPARAVVPAGARIGFDARARRGPARRRRDGRRVA